MNSLPALQLQAMYLKRCFLVSWILENHIMGWVRRDPKAHLYNGMNLKGPQSPSSLALSTARDRAFTAPLGSLCQCSE